MFRITAKQHGQHDDPAMEYSCKIRPCAILNLPLDIPNYYLDSFNTYINESALIRETTNLGASFKK